MRTCLFTLVAALLIASAPLGAQGATPPEPPPAEPPPAVTPPAEAPPAEAPPAEPAPAIPPAPPAAEPASPMAEAAEQQAVAGEGEPTVAEHRLVAYVATGIAVVSLAAGITFGVLANDQFQCAADVIACNQGRQNKIVGEELFDVRNEIEQKAIAADIAYLFAATAALVATVNYLQGFVFVDEAGSAE